MAALARYLRDKQAQYYHLEQLFQLYPHNRESYMNLATLMSQDDRWGDVIALLNPSLYYTREREELIAETQGSPMAREIGNSTLKWRLWLATYGINRRSTITW